MQGTWFPALVTGTEVPHPVCFHLFPPGLPPRESFLAILRSGEGVKNLPGWLRGHQNRPHPLGTGVLHQQMSLTLWGPCSEVRCTSSSWNNLWLGPISPLSPTSFMMQFCMSFWKALRLLFSHTLDPVTTNVLLLSDPASHPHAFAAVPSAGTGAVFLHLVFLPQVPGKSRSSKF